MAADDVAEEVTKEYCEARQPPPMKLGFGYINPQNGIANAAPVDTELEMRRYFVSKCVDTLREAAHIRQDQALMKEIREFLRRQKDDLALLLDQIG